MLKNYLKITLRNLVHHKAFSLIDILGLAFGIAACLIIYLFGLFTFLSIFISCLGLIGLSSLMTIHRTKEIGVRKVLGASIHSLLAFLSKELIKWLLISNVIACPVAYYFMKMAPRFCVQNKY